MHTWELILRFLSGPGAFENLYQGFRASEITDVDPPWGLDVDRRGAIKSFEPKPQTYPHES